MVAQIVSCYRLLGRIVVLFQENIYVLLFASDLCLWMRLFRMEYMIIVYEQVFKFSTNFVLCAITLDKCSCSVCREVISFSQDFFFCCKQVFLRKQFTTLLFIVQLPRNNQKAITYCSFQYIFFCIFGDSSQFKVLYLCLQASSSHIFLMKSKNI